MVVVCILVSMFFLSYYKPFDLKEKNIGKPAIRSTSLLTTICKIKKYLLRFKDIFTRPHFLSTEFQFSRFEGLLKQALFLLK